MILPATVEKETRLSFYAYVRGPLAECLFGIMECLLWLVLMGLCACLLLWGAHWCAVWGWGLLSLPARRYICTCLSLAGALGLGARFAPKTTTAGLVLAAAAVGLAAAAPTAWVAHMVFSAVAPFAIAPLRARARHIWKVTSPPCVALDLLAYAGVVALWVGCRAAGSACRLAWATWRALRPQRDPRQGLARR